MLLLLVIALQSLVEGRAARGAADEAPAAPRPHGPRPVLTENHPHLGPPVEHPEAPEEPGVERAAEQARRQQEDDGKCGQETPRRLGLLARRAALR